MERDWRSCEKVTKPYQDRPESAAEPVGIDGELSDHSDASLLLFLGNSSTSRRFCLARTSGLEAGDNDDLAAACGVSRGDWRKRQRRDREMRADPGEDILVTG